MEDKTQDKDFVKEALALATPARKVTKKEIEAELKRAKDAKKGLLGIEKNGAPAIDARIKELEGEKRGLSYRKLSTEPLRWRDSKGMPRLVLYSIDRPEAKFIFDGEELTVPGPTELSLEGVDEYDEDSEAEANKNRALYPDLFVYDDIYDKLQKEYEKTDDLQAIEYTTIFDGLLPTDVREIAKREKKNFDGLYILAEVKGWKRTEIARPKYADPLLLGWANPYFYVLAAFDLTPTEEYVRREFTL